MLNYWNVYKPSHNSQIQSDHKKILEKQLRVLFLLLEGFDLKKCEQEQTIIILIALLFDPTVETTAPEWLCQHLNDGLKFHV